MIENALPGPILSCIIVNWNTKELLLQCIDSIECAFTSVSHEIIVVDNASGDGSLDALRAAHPGIVRIENECNKGFAGGVNQGMGIGRGKYFLILNPDIIVGAGSISKLIAVLDDDARIGIASPKLVNADGSTQSGYVLRYPSLAQLVLFYTVVAHWSMRSPYLRKRFYEHAVSCQDGSIAVDQVPGACMLVRRDAVVDVGMMDEEYFLFFEDVDWCYRMRQKGWRLVVCPEVVWRHLGGQSFRRGDTAWVAGRFHMSLLRYFEKHGSGAENMMAKVILLVNSLLILGVRRMLSAFVPENSRGSHTESINRQKYFLREFRNKYLQRKEPIRQ